MRKSLKTASLTPRPSYNKQVFINCPFDTDYLPLFDALVFTTLDCGFTPRCAKEFNDSGQVRIEKILNIIAECRLGVHDLSRTELSHQSGLPRFNMPLELGIFLGAKTFGNAKQKSKTCLILEKEPYTYQKFLSDLAGHDISSHHNQSEKLIGSVRKWLIQYSDNIIPGESAISERYNEFKSDLPRICKEFALKQHELTYIDYLRIAGPWIDNKPF
jgi:hypothetical protein